MKIKLFVLFLLTLNSFTSFSQNIEEVLDLKMDKWHKAATEADSVYFFNFMDTDAVYIGTAPGERWTKADFLVFAMPYFRRGQAWDFKPIKRYWNFNEDKTLAWFDETITTWMENCQSTGVLELKEGKWLLKHYQLSVLIENEKIKSFIELRKK